MLKTHVIVIGLATALVALAFSTPRPAYAQTILFDALGSPGQRAGQVITAGVHVTLSARVAEYPNGLPAGWTLQILCKGKKPNWTVVQTCPAGGPYPCQRGVFSNVPGNWTCRAQLYRGPGWAVLTQSLPLTYGGAATGASQLIFEVGDKRVASNFTLQGNTLNETERCWRGGTMTTLISGRQVCTGRGDEMATPTSSPNPANWVTARSDVAVPATAYVNAPLPSAWYLRLRRSSGGPGARVVCDRQQLRCEFTFGPYASPVPGESIGADICRSSDNWCGALGLTISITR